MKRRKSLTVVAVCLASLLVSLLYQANTPVYASAKAPVAEIDFDVLLVAFWLHCGRLRASQTFLNMAVSAKGAVSPSRPWTVAPHGSCYPFQGKQVP